MSQKMQKVAVLYGGDSAEREVSIRSGQAVLNALQKSGVNAIAFDPSQRAVTELLSESVDAAVIMLHGRGGEDGTMQGALEFLGIPYTGSGVLGSALAMDKIRTKMIFQAAGLPTAAFRTVQKSDYDESLLADYLALLGGLVMVKPALEGSSVGMAKVNSPEALKQAVEAAFEYDENVLIEQFIQGKEYTVSILGERALPSISMETPRVFYDYEAKYHSNETQYHCPSGLSSEDEKYLAGIALDAFKSVNASGWGRVDFMQNDKGEFNILEVNTVPGMTEKSLVPMAAKEAGLSFDELSLEIMATAKE